MTDYRVDCITKPDRTSRVERIQALGGAWPSPWYDTEDNVIAAIDAGHTFHVVQNGYRVEVVTAWKGTTRYLKTEADSVLVDNLLYLPECR
jgi:YD repeat-containing protein